MSFTTDDGIKCFTRDDWNARSPNGSYGRTGQIRRATFHHGGDVGAPRMTFASGAATCRSFQGWHMDNNGWTDIGYHYLMDGLGRLYEGRPTWALGAHVLNDNSNSVGINLMQDGQDHGMTDDQEATVKKLFRVGHAKLELPSLKSLAAHSGDDWGVFGHRERGQSACPGDKIMADVHRLIKQFT